MPSILGELRRKASGMPFIGPIVQSLFRQYLLRRLPNSESYWVGRYAQGGDSGEGSYSKFAEQKAEVVNRFVIEQQVGSVIEFGCGDGNQLRLANYPQYIGYDISPAAIERCKELFKDDRSKTFYQVKEYNGAMADLTLSLDVIYHLTEDDVFDAYMRRLFSASSRFVIIYSSNQSVRREIASPHIRHRQFTAWIDTNMPGWKLLQQIPNRYKFEGAPADFYFYERHDHTK